MSKITFLEKDLEDIIYDTDQEIVRQHGLDIFCHDQIFRQVQLGAYGVADLITYKYDTDSYTGYRKIRITIYELKQNRVNASALLQAARYGKAIDSIFKSDKRLRNFAVSINIVLIGRTLETEGDFTFLIDLMRNLRVYTYDVDIDGLKFKEQQGYILSREGDMTMPPQANLCFGELRQLIEKAEEEKARSPF